MKYNKSRRSQGVDFTFSFLISSLVVVGLLILLSVLGVQPSITTSQNSELQMVAIEEMNYNALFSSLVNTGNGYSLPVYDFVVYLYDSDTYYPYNNQVSLDVTSILDNYFSNLTLQGILAGFSIDGINGIIYEIGECVYGLPTINYYIPDGNITLCGVYIYPLLGELILGPGSSLSSGGSSGSSGGSGSSGNSGGNCSGAFCSPPPGL